MAYYARLVFAAGPKAEIAAYRVAQCHETLGNSAAAIGAYNAYLKRFADGRFALQAQERIKVLTEQLKKMKP